MGKDLEGSGRSLLEVLPRYWRMDWGKPWIISVRCPSEIRTGHPPPKYKTQA